MILLSYWNTHRGVNMSLNIKCNHFSLLLSLYLFTKNLTDVDTYKFFDHRNFLHTPVSTFQQTADDWGYFSLYKLSQFAPSFFNNASQRRRKDGRMQHFFLFKGWKKITEPAQRITIELLLHTFSNLITIPTKKKIMIL